MQPIGMPKASSYNLKENYTQILTLHKVQQRLQFINCFNIAEFRLFVFYYTNSSTINI